MLVCTTTLSDTVCVVVFLRNTELGRPCLKAIVLEDLLEWVLYHPLEMC